jgi:hypothetical protein
MTNYNPKKIHRPFYDLQKKSPTKKFNGPSGQNPEGLR